MLLSTDPVPVRLCNCFDNAPEFTLTLTGINSIIALTRYRCEYVTCDLFFPNIQKVALQISIQAKQLYLEKPYDIVFNYTFHKEVELEKAVEFASKDFGGNLVFGFYFLRTQRLIEFVRALFDGQPPPALRVVAELLGDHIVGKTKHCYGEFDLKHAPYAWVFR